MKSNLEIVLKYLRTFEGEGTVVLPDSFRYGWIENDLCIVLTFSELTDDGWADGEDSWHVSEVSVSYFAKQCELLDEAEIMNLVFQLGRKKYGVRHTDIS